MVVAVHCVMARRRKGAVGRRATKLAKVPTKNKDKALNGLPDHAPNGIVSPKFLEQTKLKGGKMCCDSGATADGGTVLQSPPAAATTLHSLSSVHKKFGKFRCLLEVTENVPVSHPDIGAQILPEMKEEEVEVEPANEIVHEIIVEEQELDISNAEHVVWEEEVVEETVVSEGVEIEIDSRSQDDPTVNLVCQDSNYHHVVVSRSDYCNRVNDCGRRFGSDDYSCSDSNVNCIVYSPDTTVDMSLKINGDCIVRSVDDCSRGSDVSVGEVQVEIESQAVEDCGTYNVRPNVIDMIKDIALDNEEFSVQVPVPQSQVSCSSEQENLVLKHGVCCRDDLVKNHIPSSKNDSNNTYLNRNEPCVTNGHSGAQNHGSEVTDISSRSLNKRNNDASDLTSHLPSISPIQDLTTFDSLNRLVIVSNTELVCEDKVSVAHPKCCTRDSPPMLGKNCETEDFCERKQKAANFRGRSGSTDTTGSESSSSCSVGVRRSNRIRSIGQTKRKVRSRTEQSVPTAGKDLGLTKVVNSTELVNTCHSNSVTLVEEEKVMPSTSISSFPAVPTSVNSVFDLDTNKPVKVKSRWRRSSELEMGSNRSSDSELAFISPAPSISPRLPVQNVSSYPVSSCSVINLNHTISYSEHFNSAVEGKKDSRNDKKEMEERLRNYVTLLENEYHTVRTTSKEAKRMVCDCFLTKEELARGDLGCGEDCLNRLLMIECGSRCAVGDRCTNKRFQRREYARCGVFKTEKKGFGLKTLDDLPVGSFIMEYVGEVLDPKEFRRRAKDYAKDKNQHYYFMALKSDSIIDATVKGNASRFINHSCEPNAETQKWTVNGELRIGFFSKRNISAGEEITFDYQFQRYGKEAQKCLCDSANCRGWIGEDPEKEKRDRKERKEKELKKKREEKKRDLDDMDLEEEIEKLSISGLKNRTHTLTMCRLMVRAEDSDSRIQLLKLIREGEPACRRLFLDYHGLRLIWSWMVDASSNNESSLKMEILQTLAELPIPNKTMLQDSKVLFMVERWREVIQHSSSLTCENEMEENLCEIVPKKGRLSVEEESISDQEIRPSNSIDSVKQSFSQCNNIKPGFGGVLPGIEDDESIQDIESEKQVVDHAQELPVTDDLMKRSSESDDEGFGEAPEKNSQSEDFLKENGLDKSIMFEKLATKLLAEWSCLKEVFRIPKKERIEQMKEHEREADRGYKEYLDKEGQHGKQSYDRHWRQERFRSDYEKGIRKRSRDSPDPERIRKVSRFDDSTRTLIPVPKMSKEERRQLFALRVAQEEEEERQRRQQQQNQEQQQQGPWIGGPADLGPPLPGYPCYYEPSTRAWLPLPPQNQNSLTPTETSYEVPTPQLAVTSNMGAPHQGGPPPHVQPLHGLPPMHTPPSMQSTHPLAPPPRHNGPLLSHHNVPPPHHAGIQPHLNVPQPHHSMPPSMHSQNVPPLEHPLPHTLHGPYPPPHNHPPPHGPPPHGHELLSPHTPPLPLNQPPPNCPPPHVLPPRHMPSYFPPSRVSSRPPLLPTPPLPRLPLPSSYPSPRQVAPPGPCDHPEPGSLPYSSRVCPLPPHSEESDAPSRETLPFSQPPPHLAYVPTHNTQYPTTLPVQHPFTPPAPPMPPVPIRLPPKWKSAKDSEGRVYYYHVKTRVSQWEPPLWSQMEPQPESDSTSSTSDDEDEDDEDEDDTSSSEDDDEAEQDDKTEDYEDEDEDDVVDEKEEMEEEEAKDLPTASSGAIDSPEEQCSPLQEEETSGRLITDENKRKDKRREGLVQERIISPRREEDKTDTKKYKEIKEKLKRKKEIVQSRQRTERSKKHHRESKPRSNTKSAEKPVTVAADTSSDAARKIKDQFRLQMAGVIVQYLNPYRKSDCQKGRITNTEDFKHLARKLTHFVMLKELKHCRSVEDLECNDNVKHKARDFIKKYMAKFGSVYQRPKDDEQ